MTVESLDDHRPHQVFEAMCAKCLARWIAVTPVDVLLKKIECKDCGPGYVINTGQEIDDEKRLPGPDGLAGDPGCRRYRGRSDPDR